MPHEQVRSEHPVQILKVRGHSATDVIPNGRTHEGDGQCAYRNLFSQTSRRFSRNGNHLRGLILLAKDLDKLALRDHAPEILKAIALEMETAQTDLEQAEIRMQRVCVRRIRSASFCLPPG